MHPLLRSLRQAVSCDGNVISLKALSSSEVPPDNCRRPCHLFRVYEEVGKFFVQSTLAIMLTIQPQWI